jgi:hypothetical protein
VKEGPDELFSEAAAPAGKENETPGRLPEDVMESLPLTKPKNHALSLPTGRTGHITSLTGNAKWMRAS